MKFALQSELSEVENPDVNPQTLRLFAMLRVTVCH